MVPSQVSKQPFVRPTVSVQERVVPTLHTSQKIKLDRFGDEDPVGFNETYYQMIKDLTKEPETLEKNPFPMDTKQWSEESIQDLRNGWFLRYQDILQGVPNKLPPFREVNHTIPLIDDNMRYNHYLPKCGDAFKGQLLDKIN